MNDANNGQAHASFWTDLPGGAFAQGYLQAGDIRTRYLHAGDTSLPTLVLLHGVGGDAEWAAIETETPVLWTDKDPTAAVNVGEKIAGLIPNATFALMTECGHWPQFEDPPTFNKLDLDFLLARH